MVHYTQREYKDYVKMDLKELGQIKDLYLLQDMAYAISAGFTDVEKAVMDILLNLNDAITVNKIRKHITDAFIIRVCDLYVKKCKAKNLISNSKVYDFCTNFIQNNLYLTPGYPRNLQINPDVIEPLLSELFQLGGEKFEGERRDIVLYYRRVLRKHGMRTPSFDVVVPAIEFLIKKGLVNSRTNGSTTYYSASPKYVMLQRRIERKIEEVESVGVSNKVIGRPDRNTNDYVEFYDSKVYKYIMNSVDMHKCLSYVKESKRPYGILEKEQ